MFRAKYYGNTPKLDSQQCQTFIILKKYHHSKVFAREMCIILKKYHHSKVFAREMCNKLGNFEKYHHSKVFAREMCNKLGNSEKISSFKGVCKRNV